MPTTVYVAGPIDYSHGDPDDRHHTMAGIASDLLHETGGLMLVYCPHCAFDKSKTPRESIAANMRALDMSHLLVVEWTATDEPSFGTPVELWRFRSLPDFDKRLGIAVVGNLGDGLFAKALRDGGNFHEFADWEALWAWLMEATTSG